jgi:hypothetical protein
MPMRGRLIKTPEYRIYESKIQIYKLKNFRKLEEIEERFKDKMLRVDTEFFFNHNRVFTKKNTLKMIDSHNRIKICYDVLSKLIGIDDSRFIEGYHSKRYCENDKPEYVAIYISEVTKLKGSVFL